LTTSPDPNRELKVLTVCGVGMGSSLILRMNAEKALSALGVNAKVEHTDLSSARGMRADVAIAQGLHADELAGVASVVALRQGKRDRSQEEHAKNHHRFFHALSRINVFKKIAYTL
jgi:ascorbate PTS system EIIB component